MWVKTRLLLPRAADPGQAVAPLRRIFFLDAVRIICANSNKASGTEPGL